MSNFTSSQSSPKVRFKKRCSGDFFHVLQKRVAGYFKENKISTYAPLHVYLKGALHLALYLLIIAAIFSNQLSGLGIIIAYALLGITKGLVGFNIIHDALHGSYFPSQKVNRCIGYWFDFNGTSSYIWKVTHNVKHHTFTNIPGHDDDIEKAIALRLSPKDKIYWFHQYQNWYAPVLYSLLCLNWVFFSDYKWLYQQSKTEKIPQREILLFFLFKALNLLVFLLLPLLLLSVPAWAVIAGYVAMHMAAGVSISIVFQLAHIVDNVQYMEPDETGDMEYDWAMHEMLTTANFATRNSFVTELVGGLNFQIEHHLFPHTSHAHYPAISKIVREAAKEYGIPYNEAETFGAAIRSHFRRLKFLGAWKL